MINDPFHQDEAVAREKETTKRLLLGIVCAVAITAILLAGYTYFRKRHALQVITANTPPAVVESGPKGPPVAHIWIDEPTLEKGSTTIGGVVKNISKQELAGVSIAMELKRKKDKSIEQTLVPLTPARLQPDEQGSYSLKLSSKDYDSIKFVGIKADPQAALIAYSTSPGKKRPLERLQPQVVSKGKTKEGDFINTADNPTKVP
jgi:hypothetical protein